eukprot:TRINITY_DN33089_c0_g1_i2.p1 TRINITY_DN33089_c0_g1~~TRINITY_DN33089_c0_g1_i2.p1  ORF type:complete len:127 (+),score=13.71 TRINITY_DN33089_c0_g1_i2:86-466(+)
MWMFGLSLLYCLTGIAPWPDAESLLDMLAALQLPEEGSTYPIPPTSEELLPPLALDMLRGCLQCNQDDRPTAKQCLEHKFWETHHVVQPLLSTDTESLTHEHTKTHSVTKEERDFWGSDSEKTAIH